MFVKSFFYPNFKKVVLQKKEAFSIAELSVVIAAAGLMVFGVLKAGDVVSRARINATISEITQIKTAIQSFKSVNDTLPGDAALTSIKKQSENTLDFAGFSMGNNDGAISWGSGSSASNANESLLANAHLVNAGYLESPVSAVADNFLFNATPTAANLLKSTKLADVYYTAMSVQASGSDILAFATAKDQSVNFSGNNIVLGGISNEQTATKSLNTDLAAFFTNGTNFTTKAPYTYTPTRPAVSKKIIDGLTNTFGAAVKYCDEADKKIGECVESDINVVSVALLSI